MAQLSVVTQTDRREEFAAAVLTGLTATCKSIPSQFLYDKIGSELFEQITLQPEYYLTEAEKRVLCEQTGMLFEGFEGELEIIELGPGDCSKSSIILSRLPASVRLVRYRPIDVSYSALSRCKSKLDRSLRKGEVVPILDDFSSGLLTALTGNPGRRLILFLGSNIGNMTVSRASGFLKEVRSRLNAGDLMLIGFDLLKSPTVLEAAYNDRAGITERFNLNLLERINRELGGEFDVKRFQFHARFEPRQRAIVSHLISRVEQRVHVAYLNRNFQFQQWEPLLTEISAKFSEAEIRRLAKRTGFQVERTIRDQRGYFADSLWSAI